MTAGSSHQWSMTPGQTLGPWRIVEPLGIGSFAEVYKAQHQLTPRRLAAIKVLRPKRVDNEEIRRRFLQEADCLSEIDNANVVKFYDADQTSDGRIWLAMEYLVGRSLYDVFADCLVQSGAFDITRALLIGVSIADGVQAAHAIGLIHRDLKEENIFITAEGTVKVLDFGVAKLKNPELSGRAKSTAANVILGTLTHLAPEQINGGRASVQSDVYSLGVILYTLITGRHPFLVAGEEGADAQDIALRILMMTPPSPHSLAPQVTPEIEFLLLTALAKRPEHRYSSMIEFSVAMTMAFHNYKKGILPSGYTADALRGALDRATFRTNAVSEALATATPATQGSYEPIARNEAPSPRVPAHSAPSIPTWLSVATVLTVALAVALVVRPDWVTEIRRTLRLTPAAPTSATPTPKDALPNAEAPPSASPLVPAAADANAPAYVGDQAFLKDAPRASASAVAATQSIPPAPAVPPKSAPSARVAQPASKPKPAATTSTSRPHGVIIDPWADSPNQP